MVYQGRVSVKEIWPVLLRNNKSQKSTDFYIVI